MGINFIDIINLDYFNFNCFILADFNNYPVINYNCYLIMANNLLTLLFLIYYYYNCFDMDHCAILIILFIAIIKVITNI